PEHTAIMFDEQVKHAYQNTGGHLAPTVRVRRNRGVKTFQFPKMGSGMAQRRSQQSFRKLMNVVHTKVQAIGVEWEAAEFTDIFDDAQVHISEQKELAMVVSNAVNRREDQTIIDSWDASGTTNSVAKSVGGADTSLNIPKLIEARRLLGVKNIPKSDQFFAGHENSLAGLLAQTEATSIDYNSVKALVNGDIDTFMGFKFIWFGDLDEGGFGLAANTRTQYAYHGGAMGSTGLGVIMKDAVNTTYENLVGSWLTVQDFIAGAVAIDADGIVEVLTHEA
ncbi:MAG: phage capsid protein, partial [Emcibacter sp.]|nr:phage capsid protein [Emcibacter sp.]